jgi:hypothetical protein
MRTWNSGLAAGLALVFAACSGGKPGGVIPPDRPQGVSEFATPTQGPGYGGVLAGGRAEDASNSGATPAAPAPTTEQAAPVEPSTPRLIEESDIYKLSENGDTIFVLNRYRGLQIIDLTDLAAPRIVGRAPIYGYPREMYVRGSRAYIIVSDYYTFWREDVLAADLGPYAFYGSQLRIVDIADRTRPRVVGEIHLDGDVVDSRIVGSVMYLVSNRTPWYHRYDTSDYVDKTQILSVDISDPANVHVVQVKDFPRNGWEHHIMVTSDVIYLASSGYESTAWPSSYTTRIRYIDIRDPTGKIELRGEATVPGRVMDRWSMDEYQGVLRVASGQSWGNGDVYLHTFSVADPMNIRPLGSLTLQVNEQLTSARFDEKRGYLVSVARIDPLFTIDLSDPARPTRLGDLEMTGWLDFIVPMGDRLIALGHDQVATPGGGTTTSLAVSLIDVSSQSRPVLASRVIVSDGWGYVPGDRDDFAKVFKVLGGNLNLILLPFQGWSSEDYRYIGGVQLIDFDFTRNILTKRGLIENAGWVERGIPYNDQTVLTLSSEVFQILDIADRDHPELVARLELARNVQDFAVLSASHAVQLAGDWYQGDTNLTVTPLSDPDTATPTAQIHVPAPFGRMFLNGHLAYVASVQEQRDTQGNYRNLTKVQVVDLQDPLHPVLRGSVTLPEEVWLGYRYWYWGSGDEVVQVNGSLLAFHRYRYNYVDCYDCGGRGTGASEQSHKIFLVDLQNPDAPVVASTVTLTDANWAWGLRSSGNLLYLSEFQQFERDGNWFARYFLRRIDVTQPARPVVLPGVNIPGMFLEASSNGQYVYTLESWWDSANGQSRTLLHALALVGDRAYLQGSVELPGYVNNVLVKGSAAFLTTQWWGETPRTGSGPTSSISDSQHHTVLVTVNLSNPSSLTLLGQAEIPYDWAYLQKVEAGRAFIGSGAGIFSYRVTDPAQPVFEQFFRTQGWSQDIVVHGNKVFVPAGYFGVQTFELGGGQGL